MPWPLSRAAEDILAHQCGHGGCDGLTLHERRKTLHGVELACRPKPTCEVDFGSKEELASYREEDAAKTGHAVGSRGPGGGNEKRAHGASCFTAGAACSSACISCRVCVCVCALSMHVLERSASGCNGFLHRRNGHIRCNRYGALNSTEFS